MRRATIMCVCKLLQWWHTDRLLCIKPFTLAQTNYFYCAQNLVHSPQTHARHPTTWTRLLRVCRQIRPTKKYATLKVVTEARGRIVVKALCYKLEGRRFETPMRWNFSIYLILAAVPGPGVHSASNRNGLIRKKFLSSCFQKHNM
jgi:hypothetical protein